MKTLEELQKEVDIEMTIEKLKETVDDNQFALFLAFKTELRTNINLIVQEMNNMKTDVSTLKNDVDILKIGMAKLLNNFNIE